MICDKDCLHCKYPDCINDELDLADYQELDWLEKEIILPKTEAQRQKVARKKAYYEANREKVAAYMKAYREENRDKIAAYMKAYREENRDKIAARKKAYQEANRDKIAAQQKAYREANRDKINQRKRERYQQKKAAPGGATPESGKA